MTESDNDEFEEVLVYMDFGSEILSSELDNPNLDVKIIGIDSDSPVAELNGILLKGSFEYSVGTNVFFEKHNDAPPLDPLYDINPHEMYKYFTHTEKVLKMKRLFVKSKQDEINENQEETLEDLKSRLEVKITYGEALNLLLPAGAHPPRKISPDNNMDGDDNDDDDDELSDDEDEKDPDFVPNTSR